MLRRKGCIKIIISTSYDQMPLGGGISGDGEGATAASISQENINYKRPVKTIYDIGPDQLTDICSYLTSKEMAVVQLVDKRVFGGPSVNIAVRSRARSLFGVELFTEERAVPIVLYELEVKSVLAALRSQYPSSGVGCWISTKFIESAQNYYRYMHSKVEDIIKENSSRSSGSNSSSPSPSPKGSSAWGVHNKNRKAADGKKKSTNGGPQKQVKSVERPRTAGINTDITCLHGQLSVDKSGTRAQRRIVTYSCWKTIATYHNPIEMALDVGTVSECKQCLENKSEVLINSIIQRENAKLSRLSKLNPLLMHLLNRKNGVPWKVGPGRDVNSNSNGDSNSNSNSNNNSNTSNDDNSSNSDDSGCDVGSISKNSNSCSKLPSVINSTSNDFSDIPLSKISLEVEIGSNSSSLQGSGSLPHSESKWLGYASYCERIMQSSSLVVGDTNSGSIENKINCNDDSNSDGNSNSNTSQVYIDLMIESSGGEASYANMARKDYETLSAAATTAFENEDDRNLHDSTEEKLNFCKSNVDSHSSDSSKSPSEFTFFVPIGSYAVIPHYWLQSWRHYIRDPSALCYSRFDPDYTRCLRHKKMVIPQHLENFLVGSRPKLLRPLPFDHDLVIELVTIEELELLVEYISFNCISECQTKSLCPKFTVDSSGDLTWNCDVCFKCDSRSLLYENKLSPRK